MRFAAPLMLIALVWTAAARPAVAQSDPFNGYDQFPEFRNLSALAGSMYGVDASGRSWLGGPVAYSSPVAYVLGHGGVRLQYGKMSFDSVPEMASTRTNGTLLGAYGQSIGQVNVALSIMFLSESLNFATNAQVNYVPSPDARTLASIGIQDWRGHGGSAGNGVPGDEKKTRSLFGVVTHQVAGGQHPLFVSAGIGTRRFMHPFFSTSVQVSRPLRLWAEHDGFNVNFGVLAAGYVWTGRSRLEVSAHVGMVDGRYMVFGTGLGF